MLVLTSFSASLAEDIPRLHVQADEVVLIGYGSLVSRESMSKSLGRPYHGDMLPIRLQGFRPGYNVAMPNEGLFYFVLDNGRQIFPGRIAYLNIIADPESWVNGVAFTVKRSDLVRFDRREFIYDRITVAPSQIENAIVDDAEIYVYTGKSQFLIEEADSETVVRGSYHATVSAAMTEIGFYDWFHSTIGTPPHRIVEDQMVPDADPFGYRVHSNRRKRNSCEDALGGRTGRTSTNRRAQ